MEQIKKLINNTTQQIDLHITNLLLSQQESSLTKAATYSCIAPESKRIRPFLVIQTAKVFEVANTESVLTIAAAVEMIHTYSLIHDDLPAIDNDDVRRGQPSCHKKFSESTAILTGNALLIFAFELLTKTLSIADSRRCLIMLKLSQTLGFNGMMYGQMLDIEAKHKNISLDILKKIHFLKTAKFMSISCLIGALMGNASNTELDLVEDFGNHLGMIFQITDDLLDEEDKQFDECNITKMLDKKQIMLLLEHHEKRAMNSLSKLKNRNTDILEELLLFLKNRTK